MRTPARLGWWMATVMLLAGSAQQRSLATEPRGKARLRVAVVIDASGSMKKQDRNLLSKVAAKLFVDLAGPRDEVGIVEFGTTARLIDRAFVTDEAARARLFAAIDKVGRSQYCTDYLAALEAALQMFPGRPEAGERRLVIFLTDGTFDPNRANPKYYELLSPQERAQLFPKKAADLFEKVKSDPLFKEKACHARYKLLEPAARAGFLKAMDQFIQKRLVPSGVRLFVIGFGTELGKANARGAEAERIARSVALLKELAAKTKGRALIEHDVNRIPGFFAEIFASLVGAPVESLPHTGGAPFDFKVVRGTRALAVVVPTLAAKKLDVELGLVEKGKVSQLLRATRTRHHDEVLAGRTAAGYRLLWLARPKPGTYRVLAKGGPAKKLKAQVVMDVGLRLMFLEPKPKAVYPETEKGERVFRFALRTASGEKVSGLSRKFLQDMVFSWVLLKGIKKVASGQAPFDPGAPMKPMEVRIPAAKLSEGSYVFAAWGGHTKGFFELPRLEASFRVVQYVEMKALFGGTAFQVKPKEKWSHEGWLTVRPDRDLKSVQWFWLDLGGVQGLDLLKVRYSNDTPECPVKGKMLSGAKVKVCLHTKAHGIRLDVSLEDWTKARKASRKIEGPVVLRAANPQIFKGDKEWKGQVHGRIQGWTIWDWLAFYKKWLILAALALILVLWLLGRVLAGAFPPKATLYYRDLEDSAGEPSRYALGRRATSHLPFVSAKHDIGGKGMPRGGRVLATLVAATGGGFYVEPRAPVKRKDDGEEFRERFRGTYGEHYVAGDRFEFWVTRTPED